MTTEDTTPALIPIDGGWRVKTTEDGQYFIDILAMAFNFRIVTTPVDHPSEYTRFWCYTGTTEMDFVRTVLAASIWNGAQDTEPEGWDKNGQTKVYRAPEFAAIFSDDPDLSERVKDIAREQE
jgi:hypothetical protein